MTEERAKRKLSGILSADAVGYSRLMEKDEASTIRNLEASKSWHLNQQSQKPPAGSSRMKKSSVAPSTPQAAMLKERN